MSAVIESNDTPFTAGRQMVQDDGVRVYVCNSTDCGYDGDTYCQNCGYEKAEGRQS
jgi:hypothetical protein